MRQRTLFEVYELDKSDSDKDAIVVRPAIIRRPKRQRDGDDSTTDVRPRKVTRNASASRPQCQPRRSTRPTDDPSSAQVSEPNQLPSSSRPTRLTQSGPVTEKRNVLGEVSTSQFQNRLRGPIAWFKPPAYKAGFLSQFPSVSNAQTTPPSPKRFLEQGSIFSRARSRRVSVQRTYSSIASSGSELEDELAQDDRLPTRKKPISKAKPAKVQSKKRAQEPDDSDFFAESIASDEEFDDSDIPMDDGSSIEASESDDDNLFAAKKSSKASKAPAKSAAKANTSTSASTAAKPRATAKEMVNLLKGATKGLDLSLPPVSSITDIFQDLTSNAVRRGFDKAVEHLQKSRPLRVATMCSGTESPLLALEMIKTALGSQAFEIEHLFSAELVPFKQAYIERNFHPPLIFRDITELIDAFKHQTQPIATTAYGAKVPVPTDIDILIAGTSCVDYSGMNSRKKGINDGGESGDTWRAVMDFCIVARPAIVLLENVKSAPWDHQLKEYQDIGYETAGTLVNTKDYYIPHIRQRGYMACFDKQKLKSGGSSKAASQWSSLMEAFKRPASSPVSSFLLPNDRIVRQHLRTDEPVRDVDWSTCEIRQMQYRQELRLGNARPITNWSASGSMQVPDNGHAVWYQKQVERVLDTIDVGNLRKALPKFGMYDNRFKTRVVDLSQNVDRDTDHRAFGVVGCITPSGMFFVSDAGRPLTSEETLQLQGLPLDRISFTTESPSDVQDLAGNAMSTTVIGSSILAALIAGYRMIPPSKTAVKVVDNKDTKSQHVPVKDMQTRTFQSGSELKNIATLLEKASRSLRRCYCEGPKGMTSKPIQQCSDCGHTTCVVCGGNPLHNYRGVPSLVRNVRLVPGQFEQELRKILPLRLKFGNNDISLNDLLADVANTGYHERVSKALQQTYSFHDIRRTSCWTAIYRSDFATLELVIEDELSAEWRLFAHAPTHVPGNDGLRVLLQQPVARGKVLPQDGFLASDWQVRVPTTAKFPVTVKASGPKLASWWARNEMPDFLDHFVWDTLTVEAEHNSVIDVVSGVYRHLPNCGMACNSLYKKACNPGDRAVYLFLDPTKIGEPDKDCFVFSHNKALLEYDEIRPVIARVDASWRPWSTTVEKKGIPATTHANLLVDDAWVSLRSEVGLYTTDASLEICFPHQASSLGQNLDCTTMLTLISCCLPANLESSGTQFLQPHQAGFYEKYGWMFEALRRNLPLEEWLPVQNDYDGQCDKCAPARPEIRWALSDSGNVVAQEDPATAAAYERAIKARPKSLIVAVAKDGHELQVGINIASLAHRAGARLRQSCDQEAAVSYVWRFTTDANRVAHSFTFKPFSLLHTTGIDPWDNNCGLTVELFPKQRLALAWMQKQEQGVEFLLEELEESSLGSLGWQAEVKAQTPVVIKGGICADHPGFGKTILSLALIQSEWVEKSRSGILLEIHNAPPSAAGLMPIAATLIICPAALLKQWQSEIDEKLLVKRKVVAINATKDLEKYTISDFENATIVMTNRSVFGADAYAERLAAFAGVPGPATKSGRAFAHWLKSVAKDIPGHVRILDRGFGLKKLQRHLKDVYKANLEGDKFKMSVPSRRLRGRDYVAGKDRKKSGIEETAAAPDIDVNQVGKPLLEMFYFNRIMVDEFHQYEPKERVAIAGLKADKRWGLSATPAMDDFYDISQTAALLGVSLRTSSGAKGVLKTKNARDMKKEMTSFEQFDMMRHLPSDSMHAHIHATDQRFLDTFVRRNIMDFNEQLVCFEHLLPVRLDVSHMALYSEISQHLNSLDMRIKKSTKGKATDRQERFHSVTNDCTTAEEALSKAAAFLDKDDRDIDQIVIMRDQQAGEVLAELPAALRVANSEEPVAFAHWKASRLDGGILGDLDTVEEVSRLVQSSTTASKNKKKAAERSNAESDADSVDQDGKVTFAGKKEKTAKLNAMCGRLLKAKRSARYLQNVKRICAAVKKGNETLCDNGSCRNKDLHAEAAGVSVLCGHLVCGQCYARMKQQGSTTCPASGCSESMQDIHLLWSQKMGDLSRLRTTHGAKAEAAMGLLKQIEAQGDQAILFAQYEDQMDQISAALKTQDISAVVVTSALNAGRQVEQFRNSSGTDDQITVMVLNASDETAAGLNLQNANHVIFLSPLLRDSQYGYDSTMAQAIGRVRRYGQKKEIHVHRIVALDTIDVDILEHRERRNTALTEQRASDIAPPATAKELDQGGRQKREKTQLVCEDGLFSLRPQSWLVRCGADEDAEEVNKVKGKNRVLGWEDFSSLVKFSKTFTEDDDW